ncbi:uncharacterized protein G2W53_033907 [Senna tora]|uniref:MULE transposase domain-containing protein n=1 Tax=Senna tora TaxID=362788 RepID=A0A834WBE9_9FABA|nr:uncharacterized protein G2W53_033907 [Senna tora]
MPSSSILPIAGRCQPLTENLAEFIDEDESEANVPIRNAHDEEEQDDDDVGEDLFEEEATDFYSQVEMEASQCFSGDFPAPNIDGDELYEGMNFPTKAVFRKQCPYFGKSCAWRLRATQKVNTNHWEITIYPSKHTCVNTTLTEDHPKLDFDMIATCIVSMVTREPNVFVASIIKRINDKFNCTVSYKKAWAAKHKTIAKVFGNWESSYNKLPRWMAVVQYFIPGTVVKFFYKPHRRGVPSDLGVRIFQQVFWAYKPCIDAFPHLKPMIQVDGTFLYGKYIGTPLIASSQDGNNNIVPLAFAIAEGKTLGAWSWFLKNVREHVVGDRENICLISYRHVSITSVVGDESIKWQPPYAYHVYCVRHLASNLNKRFKET